MKYDFKTSDVYDFANAHGYETQLKGTELQFRFCPYCNGGSHRDEYTFSINIEKGVYKCLRSSCYQQGHFVELCRDFDFKLDFGEIQQYRKLQKPTEYRKPVNKAYEYFNGRGISNEIVEKYEITTHKHRDNLIVFPFYDEQGELRTVKYRDTNWVKGCGKPKEWFETNTMPILFGMKQCTDFSRLIITEGQIDALSVAQAGFSNAVSVPGGMSNFKWFTLSAEWINSFNEIVVFGDWENGKMTLLDEIRARAKTKVRAVRHKDYLGEKDANDILRSFGTQAIEKAVLNAEEPKIEAVKELADTKDVDLNKLPKIKTQITDLDKITGGMIMGEVILLSGKRGSGKSTLLNQFISAALDQGESVFAYSGELPDFHFKRWLDLQLAGRQNLEAYVDEYGQTVYTIPEDVNKQISDWYRGRMYIYDNNYLIDAETETEGLCDTIRKVIETYDTRLICIDNLMTAMEAVQDSDQLYSKQSNFVRDLKKIAIKYKVCIVLVAHVRKSGNKEQKSSFDNDEVMGSSNITNLVDVVLNYDRKRQEGDEPLMYNALISVAKNRLFGILKFGEVDGIKLRYFPDSRRLKSINDTTVKEYGWVKHYEQMTLPDKIEW